jgi:hypothetical protein
LLEIIKSTIVRLKALGGNHLKEASRSGIKIYIMKNIYGNLIVAFILFSTFVAVGQIQYSNEFWISTNATGNVYPSSLGTGGGTLANPLDGSTVSSFDSNMNNLPANCVIHILPGTYQTHGGDGWWVHSGEKIIGSGIDVTTLQLVPTPSDNFTYTIDSEDYLTNVVVSGLTIDCNYTSGSHTPCGISLGGTENTIRDVKVIHCAKYGGSSEAWGIVISGNSSGMSVGNLIEHCEVSEFVGGSGLSAIGFLPQVSGVIRDNVVINENPNNLMNSFFGSCGDLVQGNYAYGVDTAYHSDTSVVTNLIVADNIFENVRDGFGMWPPFLQNVTLSDNTIFLSTNTPFQEAFAIAPSELSTNVNIIGNTVGWYSAETTAGFFVDVTNLQGLVVADNRVDATLGDNLNEGTATYIIRDNYDLSGNYLSINIPTIGDTPVSPLGFDLIGGNQTSALINLGLPGNPSVLVTNGETQSLTFNTNIVVNGTNFASYFSGSFIGNGAGLTNVVASSLVGDQTLLLYPTNGAGWYRVAYGNNFISSEFTIIRSGAPFDNESENVIFNAVASGYVTSLEGVGLINFLGGFCNGGIVYVRIGNTGSQAYVDLYVDGSYASPFTIQSHGPYGQLLSTQQYLGTGNTSQPTKTEDIATTSSLEGVNSLCYTAGTNEIRLTDENGYIEDSALNIVDPSHGGLGLDASGWGAGLIPYTTGYGTFGSTSIGSFGQTLLSETSGTSTLSALGLPVNPAVILTNNEAQSVYLSSLNVANGATITNGLTVNGNEILSGDLAIGGAPIGPPLSVLGNGTSAAFLTPTNIPYSLICFGYEDLDMMYAGVLESLGYPSFVILNGFGNTNNPIAVFNSNIDGGNGYVGIGTNFPSQELTVAGNILVTGTNYATQFVGGGAGLTGLNPANIAAGTAVINISGNAATASSATNVVGNQSSLTVTNLNIGMEVSIGGTPTVTSASPNVTNVLVTGHDRAFQVTFSGLGNGVVAGGTNFFSVGFSNTNYTNVPLVVWQSANLNAANMIYNIGQPYISSSSKTNFVFAVDIVNPGSWGAGTATTNCTMTFFVNQ